MTAFFAEAQKRGFKSAIGDVVYWAIDKIKGEERDEKRLAKDRGALLLFADAREAERTDTTRRKTGYERG